MKAVNIYAMDGIIQYINPNNCKSGVYRIVAPSGHFLVGSTNNFYNRCYKQHFANLKLGKHYNPHLQNRFNKTPVGWRFEVVEEVVNEDDLLAAEQKYIDIYFGQSRCMNINPFACKPPSAKGRKRSKEFIEKQKKRIPWNVGKPGTFKNRKHTTASKQRMSESHVGKAVDKATKTKISYTLRGRTKSEIIIAKRQISRFLTNTITNINISKNLLVQLIKNPDTQKEYLDVALALLSY